MMFRRALAVVAGVLPASLVAVLLFLALYSWPALRFNGLSFVSSNTWNLGSMYGSPITRGGVQMLPGAHYGILFLIVGTLLSTLLALIIAVPIGVGAAIFLAEAVPGRARLWLSFLVELLAAVPSVVFGLWGLTVVIPLLGHHVFPWLAAI
ncbi:MAG: phosphate ABC transporter permease subunit PstC, partial [Pseudomonadota bacterium]|nr:phosphate ABC transporter permease subunit PstC [Pseudomonadota bacterium]